MEAKDLICRLMTASPADRCTISQALGHAWFTGKQVSTGNNIVTVDRTKESAIDHTPKKRKLSMVRSANSINHSKAGTLSPFLKVESRQCINDLHSVEAGGNSQSHARDAFLKFARKASQARIEQYCQIGSSSFAPAILKSNRVPKQGEKENGGKHQRKVRVKMKSLKEMFQQK